VYEPREHQITGYPDEVASALRLARVQERLLSDPAIIRNTVVRHPDGRVSVQARMLTAHPVPSRWARFWEGSGGALAVALGIGTACSAFLGSLILAGYYALTGMWHAVAALHLGPMFAAVLLAGPILWIIRVVIFRPACPGLHCGGCLRHRG
jgi:hypothetical protein